MEVEGAVPLPGLIASGLGLVREELLVLVGEARAEDLEEAAAVMEEGLAVVVGLGAGVGAGREPRVPLAAAALLTLAPSCCRCCRCCCCCCTGGAAARWRLDLLAPSF